MCMLLCMCDYCHSCYRVLQKRDSPFQLCWQLMILFGKNNLRSVQSSPVKLGGQLQVFGAVHTSRTDTLGHNLLRKRRLYSCMHICTTSGYYMLKVLINAATASRLTTAVCDTFFVPRTAYKSRNVLCLMVNYIMLVISGSVCTMLRRRTISYYDYIYCATAEIWSWITVSTIGSTSPSTVRVYDGLNTALPLDTKKQIAAIVHSPEEEIKLEYANVQVNNIYVN